MRRFEHSLNVLTNEKTSKDITKTFFCFLIYKFDLIDKFQ